MTLFLFRKIKCLKIKPALQNYAAVSAKTGRLWLGSALPMSGPKRRLGLTLPPMYAAPMLISRSDLIATLMVGVVEASGRSKDLVVLPPPMRLQPIEFVTSWHRRNDAHPAQRWFRDGRPQKRHAIRMYFLKAISTDFRPASAAPANQVRPQRRYPNRGIPSSRSDCPTDRRRTSYVARPAAP
jgi:hypothetical protein